MLLNGVTLLNVSVLCHPNHDYQRVDLNKIGFACMATSNSYPLGTDCLLLRHMTVSSSLGPLPTQLGRHPNPHQEKVIFVPGSPWDSWDSLGFLSHHLIARYHLRQ